MLNPGSGLDEAKYYALLVTVAMDASPRLRAKALRCLEKAVKDDAARRCACRDVDVSAAVRVRLWA